MMTQADIDEADRQLKDIIELHSRLTEARRPSKWVFVWILVIGAAILGPIFYFGQKADQAHQERMDRWRAYAKTCIYLHSEEQCWAMFKYTKE